MIIQSHSSLDLDRLSPEVRSYIYQTVLEFEPYTTPSTSVAFVSKDISESIHTDLNSYQIVITLSDGDSKIEAEGVHLDLITAVRLAKEKLLKMLEEIQDEVISNQDRQMQIRFATTRPLVH